MTKDELKKEFEKYLKDSSDYYDPREPLTERKLLQMWLDCAEPREKRIAELEKENAELKTNFKIAKDNEYEYLSLLTKAKELLKQWLQTSNASSCDNINIVTDTEQFISEVEK